MELPDIPGIRLSPEALAALVTQVPDHLHEGIVLWFEQCISTGSFLSAVIQNDLKGAFAQADHINRHRLFDIVQWFYWHAPGGTWGSINRFDAWSARGADWREHRDAVTRPLPTET